MENSLVKRKVSRDRRVLRVRRKTKGSESRPRFTVCKSNNHIFAQIINDDQSVTLVSAGTISKENKGSQFNCKSKEAAKHLGKHIAELALKKGIEKVVFDRGRYKFHGIVAELANAARAAGLQF